ncbi:MAG TPA: hypothetical protein VHG52_11560, partial [Thermomicrobiales bacterium]|nr:hypothetical protein [Thermomicrobiales bacterium]
QPLSGLASGRSRPSCAKKCALIKQLDDYVAVEIPVNSDGDTHLSDDVENIDDNARQCPNRSCSRALVAKLWRDLSKVDASVAERARSTQQDHRREASI